MTLELILIYCEKKDSFPYILVINHNIVIKLLQHFKRKHETERKFSNKKTYNAADLKSKVNMLEARNTFLEEEVDLLKKFTPFLSKSCMKTYKYSAINTFIELYTFPNMTKSQSLSLLCSYLEIFISGYYASKKRISLTTVEYI